MQKPNGRRAERKGMKSRSSVCTALVTFPFLENWLVLRMDHLKSDECGGEGEGGEENFQFTRFHFFSIAISMNTFIRVRKSSFLLLLLFCENIHIGWVRLENLGLDFKIRISDLQSNAPDPRFFYTNRILKMTVYMMLSFFQIQIHVIRNDTRHW